MSVGPFADADQGHDGDDRQQQRDQRPELSHGASTIVLPPYVDWNGWRLLWLAGPLV